MKFIAILTLIALVSQLICGFWMRSQPEVDPSSVSFHMILGLGVALLATATSVFVLRS
jgi:hypothetical protein